MSGLSKAFTEGITRSHGVSRSSLYPNPDPISKSQPITGKYTINVPSITSEYTLNVPLTVPGQEVHIRIEVVVKHRPDLCSASLIESLLGPSIQQTLQDQFETQELFATQDSANSCFVCALKPEVFQGNIGLHATIIDSISIKIPYSRATTEVRDKTADKADYCTLITLFYQEQPDVDSSPRTRAILNEAALRTRAAWNGNRISTIAEIGIDNSKFFEKYLGGVSPGQVKLKLQVQNGIVILMITRAADEVTVQKIISHFKQKQMIDEATEVSGTARWFGYMGSWLHLNDLVTFRQTLIKPGASSPKPGFLPEMTVTDCQEYVKNKKQALSECSLKSSLRYGVIAGLAFGSVYTLRHVNDSTVFRCLLTMGLTVLVGPLGAIAGLLRKC